MTERQGQSWKGTLVTAALGTALVTVLAWVLEIWVLTALPIGFWFGFFLQKGDLCGASAFSEVVLFREGKKLFGLWVAIGATPGRLCRR